MPCALIVMGVSGSGKSTIADKLAERLRWSYEDGDKFHPASNVAKMSAGHPLTDEDRWPWLQAIADEARPGLPHPWARRWQRRPIYGVSRRIANRSGLDKLKSALLSVSRKGGSIAPARARGFDEAQRGPGRESCSG